MRARVPPASFRSRLVGVYAVLAIANLGAWAWALMAFRDYPLVLGTALLAYTLGLRHAVDADHIAAIDNVTRKLMQEGQRPVTVGLFFSLGHSTVVIAASIAIAMTTAALQARFADWRNVGGVIGTLVSALFLFAIAAINLVVLASLYRTFRRARATGSYVDADLDTLLAGGGLLARIFRSLFRLVRRSWHMYPLGLLFGLGFDTATEIGLLGISAAQASRGMPIWSILVFPMLFTTGMSLLDTTDGILMIGAYGWAFIQPLRKLYYNLTITAVSVAVALLVGGIETLGLIGDKFRLTGSFWNALATLNHNFGAVGVLVIGVFVGSWLISAIIYRANGLDTRPLGHQASSGGVESKESGRPRDGGPPDFLCRVPPNSTATHIARAHKTLDDEHAVREIVGHLRCADGDATVHGADVARGAVKRPPTPPAQSALSRTHVPRCITARTPWQ